VKAEAARFHRLPAAVMGLVVFGTLYGVVKSVKWPVAEPTHAAQPTSATLGTLLLSRYLLPFEVVSVLLLVVLIGAVIVGKKEVEE
jgi:NADH-quinone oxidoreductase subunit J